ncbi:4-amino-4-deoxy-L-arabinose transferase-like glycosyltransferase [Luteibacter sp. Sphag1AF]|uniref:glycosyltransferase family 39 protein n=1 Tax=Luteibacter sp. Sphag1AF TaxID=2587031 RepID=UPI00160C86AC|nr:glycosyltransferase family 39 protein [Luteibacter sp. Sphag1AF]MBB3228085.1 4-amino-4-deoxy-L-arabinose transferase-like glycosyltransferase [Luteibacter sp. Sphag1AF]
MTQISDASGTHPYRDTTLARLGWPGTFNALIAVTCCVFAFIGISSSSLWGDELFTMRLVDHHQGLGDVFQRMLSDVHPPLYDFLLYGWVEYFGTSELAVRLPSAILAVLCILLFVSSTRRRFSPAAIAFACAVATSSMFWYVQAQNARNYSLAMVISAALLATAVTFHRRICAGERFPAGPWLTLTLLAIAGSQTHAYMLLVAGMVFLFLLLATRNWPQRIGLCLSGLVVLGLYVALLWMMIHAPEHDFDATWFRNSAGFFSSHLRRAIFQFMSRQALLIVVVMLVMGWIRRQRAEPATRDPPHTLDWEVGLCGFVIVGVIAGGIAVSLLVAPSFSYRNVLVCAPFGWLLLARLYDAAGPRTETRKGAIAAAAIVILLGSQAAVLCRGRLLPSTEPWRASAAYVQGLPGCNGATLPVISQPRTYGPSLSPRVRFMIERRYYGYYLPSSYHPLAYLADDWVRQAGALVQSNSTCPVLGWILHDVSEESAALTLARQFVSQPGTGNQLVIQEINSYELSWMRWKAVPRAYVFLRATPRIVEQAPALPAGVPPDKKYALGNRLLLTFNPSAPEASAWDIRRLHSGTP